MKRRKFEIVVWIWCAALTWFVAYASYKDINAEVNTFHHVTGRITKTVIVQRPSTVLFLGFLFNVESKAFGFQIEGVDKTFTVFRSDRNYVRLLDKLKNQDLISIYYQVGSSDSPFVSAIQIQQQNQVIYGKQEWNKQESVAFWLCVCAGFLFLVVGWTRHKRRNSVTNTGYSYHRPS